MKIVGIACVSPEMGLGFRNSLLYKNKTDMAFFCGFTQGKLVVMGRKTVESLPAPLYNRDVVCVSKGLKTPPTPLAARLWDGYDIYELIDMADGRDVVICGGSEIYKMFEPLYDEFFITRMANAPQQKPDAFLDIDLSIFGDCDIVMKSKQDALTIFRLHNRSKP